MTNAYLTKVVLNQFEAAMCTLKQAIDTCPDSHWSTPHLDSPFSQVVFHVLIMTDIYLGRDEEGIKTQPFHVENKDIFLDYEELEDRIPVRVYERAFVLRYFDFVLTKGRTDIPLESNEALMGESGFSFRPFSRLELYLYFIRHIQHHAAQLGLRNQFSVGTELRWVGSGWKNL